MQKHRDLTVSRIHQFGERLVRKIYSDATPLSIRYQSSLEPIPFHELKRRGFASAEIGDEWGKDFDCAWFELKGKIPPTMRGKQVVALIDLGGEACVMDPKSGKPLQGLTPKFEDQHGGVIGPKREVPIKSKASGNEVINLLLDAGANHLQGRQRNCRIRQADLCVRNELAFQLFHRFRFAELMMLALPKDNRQGQLLLRALNDICNLVTEHNDSEYQAALKRLKPELAHRAVDTALNVSAVGHAHLDVAWLWPLRETVRKCGRTFSTALQLIKRYPKYQFGASQPHLYQMTKDHYPELYRDIKKAVKDGRWEVQGGMWVESDCNIPSGESLVRQVLWGKRFYQDEFGIEVKHLWLPDVFGYSGALPQILRKSGIDYFTTHKLNWNQFNQFPHHTMYWQGIDGSKIFSHFMTGNDYNVPSTPQSFMNFESSNRDGDRTSHALCLFGIGDGGGGPGMTHIEWTQLAEDFQGLPKVTMEPAADFFPKAEAESTDLLTWVGELYFEYHRGTYTSQALVKKMNRKLEYLCREVEYCYSQLPPKLYPKADLERIWKVILLNQFHDIIPGSSITRVYDEAHAQYREADAELQALLHAAHEHIAARTETKHLNEPLLLNNSLSWQRQDLVYLDGERRTRWQDTAGQAIPSQKLGNGVLLDLRLAPLSTTAIEPGGSKPDASTTLRVSTTSLENALIKVDLHPKGGIRRIFDKQAKRDVLTNVGNTFGLYEDLPLAYEAWDIDAYYLEKAAKKLALISSEVKVEGELMVGVQQIYEAEGCRISQLICLHHHSRLLEFVTTVDWQTSQQMLRVDFPVNVQSTEANFEIQFGHLARPTHMNTSWDMARFESVGHKWADLSQPNYGVALMNDSKYGYRIQGNVMSLNLLRSPTRPDPKADRHQHEFRYGLYPHDGNHVEAEIVQRAYEFNVKSTAFPGRDNHKIRRPAGSPVLSVSKPHVIIDTIKRAEDNNDIIVRLYEAHGIDGTVELELSSSIDQAFSADLMETCGRALNIRSGRLKIDVKPFEIITLALR